MPLSLYRHFSAVIGQAKRGKAHLTLVIAGEIASVRGWASHFRAVFPQKASRRLAFFAAF